MGRLLIVRGKGLLDRLQPLLGRTLGAALALAILASANASSAEDADGAPAGPSVTGLAGQLLVAAPSMPDPRFAKTIIFMVRHDRHGAMGLVINRFIGLESAIRLLDGAGGKDTGEKDTDTDGDVKVRVHYGGPVEPRRGFIVHSSDYAEDATVAVTDRVSVTAATRILHAIAKGKGPDRGFLAVGYSGWAPGQLERELARKDWVVVPADDQLVFDSDQAGKWRRAMDRHGIEL